MPLHLAVARPVSILPTFFIPSVIGFVLVIVFILVAKVWFAKRSRNRSTLNIVRPTRHSVTAPMVAVETPSSMVVDAVLEPVTVVRRSLLTANEVKFFHALQEAVVAQYVVFTQLPLWTMVDTSTEDRKASTTFRNKISLKRVDFVLADPITLESQIVVELDDRSHDRADRMKRDALVASVLDQAGIPLVRVQASGAYSPAMLRNQLGSLLPHKRSA